MTRPLRTLLLLLLLATLPFQGAVAAARMVCGPEHAQHAMTASNGHHDHTDANGDGHAHHSAQHAGSSTASHAPDLHPHPACGHCAGCCIGGIAVPSPGMPMPDDHPAFSALSPAPLPAGFIPAGLERPPKRISA